MGQVPRLSQGRLWKSPICCFGRIWPQPQSWQCRSSQHVTCQCRPGPAIAGFSYIAPWKNLDFVTLTLTHWIFGILEIHLPMLSFYLSTAFWVATGGPKMRLRLTWPKFLRCPSCSKTTREPGSTARGVLLESDSDTRKFSTWEFCVKLLRHHLNMKALNYPFLAPKQSGRDMTRCDTLLNSINFRQIPSLWRTDRIRWDSADGRLPTPFWPFAWWVPSCSRLSATQATQVEETSGICDDPEWHSTGIQLEVQWHFGTVSNTGMFLCCV